MPLGIPHSRFLAWSEDDQDKALAWKREQALTCSGCGTRKDEWEEDRDAYISVHEVCPGCQRIAEENENVPDQIRGAKVGLLPKAEYFANRGRYEE